MPGACFNSTPVHSSPAPSRWLYWREPPQPQWRVSFYIHDSRTQWVCRAGSPSMLSRFTQSSASLDHYFTCSLLSLNLQDLLDFLTSFYFIGGKNIETPRRELPCSLSSYFPHCICFLLAPLHELVGFLCEAKPSTMFLISSLLTCPQT